MDATDPGPVRRGMESFSDPVNHPSHYTQYLGMEVIDLTEQMNFNKGNAVKYIARSGFKSNEIEDLEKAAWYIAREISRVKKLESQVDRSYYDNLVDEAVNAFSKYGDNEYL